ncbi:MAG: tetratricopeptide repeat protein, partial [Holophagales bacterium]|nr:tetratricopeptide repeat protein [Holophagales bacterium]
MGRRGTRNRIRANLAALAVLVLWVEACGVPSNVEEPRAPKPRDLAAPRLDDSALTSGSSVEAILPAAGEGRHRLDLESGQAVRLEVDQLDFDLVVETRGPDGERILSFDGPYGRAVAERLCFVASRRGFHTIHVTPLVAGRQGRYRLRLLEVGPATDEDRSCLEASRAFMAAQQRFAEEGRSDRLASELRRISRRWVKAGEPLLGAVALRQAGHVERGLGRSTAAAALFSLASSWARDAGSGYLEIRLLLDLGQTAIDQGRWLEAEEHIEQALQRAQLDDDPHLESLVLGRLAAVEQRLGDVHAAIEHLRRALAMRGDVAGDVESARMQIDLANTYALLDRYREALDLLERAAATCHR